MRTLLITPPLIQLNSPYPATGVLCAYLRQQGYDAQQWDLSIDLIEKIFCKEFLAPLFGEAFERERLSQKARAVALKKDDYLRCVESVVRFLQGKDDSLATRIASRGFLPEGSRCAKLDDEALEWAFGTTGFHDRAKHLASLFMLDLSDFIADMVTRKFSLIKYGEQIALSAPTFDYIERELQQEPNLIDQIMLDMLCDKIEQLKPEMVGITVPFPGCLYSALRCGKLLKEKYDCKVVIGGGYISTELRHLNDTRVFDYADYLIFDDGELPLSRLIEHLEGKIEDDKMVRTVFLKNNKIVPMFNQTLNVPFSQLPAPTYDGIDLSKYISLIEFTNPMHKLWSDGRWLKITFAHGCYWGKCTFCDTNLDYISRYEATSALEIYNKVEQVVSQTGLSGIHFTDEALPPKLLIEFAQLVIERGLVISFWGNIRFDKSYTLESCKILAQAGCVAVTGGLEVASPRVLKLINKGITVESAVEATYNFTSAGIMVHTYLMYGFPTQTYQECVDSLEIVRQMFENGLVQSAFWHRYTMTEHSPTGIRPEDFGVERVSKDPNPFANNTVEYFQKEEINYKKIQKALQNSTYNYMQGIGYDISLKNWFEDKMALTQVPRSFVARIIDRLEKNR